MFVVIKYMNHTRLFNMEIVAIVDTIEKADYIALKKAEEKYGFDISNTIESLIDIKNIISEYSLGDGLYRDIYAVIKHE